MSSTETSKEPWPWIWQRGFPLVFLKPCWKDFHLKETEPYKSCLNLFQHLTIYSNYSGRNQVLIPWIFQWDIPGKTSPILNLEIQGTPVAQRDLDLSCLDLSLRSIGSKGPKIRCPKKTNENSRHAYGCLVLYMYTLHISYHIYIYF